MRNANKRTNADEDITSVSEVTKNEQEKPMNTTIPNFRIREGGSGLLRGGTVGLLGVENNQLGVVSFGGIGPALIYRVFVASPVCEIKFEARMR